MLHPRGNQQGTWRWEQDKEGSPARGWRTVWGPSHVSVRVTATEGGGLWLVDCQASPGLSPSVPVFSRCLLGQPLTCSLTHRLRPFYPGLGSATCPLSPTLSSCSPQHVQEQDRREFLQMPLLDLPGLMLGLCPLRVGNPLPSAILLCYYYYYFFI